MSNLPVLDGSDSQNPIFDEDSDDDSPPAPLMPPPPSQQAWNTYARALVDEQQVKQAQARQLVQKALRNERTRQEVITKEIERVRRLQMEQFEKALSAVALRPFAEEYRAAVNILQRNDEEDRIQRFVPKEMDTYYERRRQSFLDALDACSLGLPPPVCVYDGILALAGTPHTNSNAVRDALLQLLGSRLPGGPCGPIDDLLLNYSHATIQNLAANTGQWHLLTEAHMAVFLGHPYERCDGLIGKDFVDREEAKAEFLKRVQTGPKAKMKPPAQGVFGDPAARAAVGVFLELAEDILLREGNEHGQAFRQFQESLPDVSVYAPALPLLANSRQAMLRTLERGCPSDTSKRRMTGRHLCEVGDGELAARVCAYMYRIATREAGDPFELGKPTAPPTYTVDGTRVADAAYVGRVYIHQLFQTLASVSVFPHCTFSTLSLLALFRASAAEDYYSKTGILNLTLEWNDPLNDTYELVRQYRNHLLRCGNGSAAAFNTDLIYQFYRYREGGADGDPGRLSTVVPNPNAYLNKTQEAIFNERTFYRAYEWARRDWKNGVRVMLGSVSFGFGIFSWFGGWATLAKIGAGNLAVPLWRSRYASEVARSRSNAASLSVPSSEYQIGDEFIGKILTKIYETAPLLQQTPTTSASALGNTFTIKTAVDGLSSAVSLAENVLMQTSVGNTFANLALASSAMPLLSLLVQEQIKKDSSLRRKYETVLKRGFHSHYKLDRGWLEKLPPTPCAGPAAPSVDFPHFEGSNPLEPSSETQGPLDLVTDLTKGPGQFAFVPSSGDNASRLASAAFVLNTLTLQDILDAATGYDDRANAALSDESLLVVLAAAVHAKTVQRPSFEVDVSEQAALQTKLLAALDRSDLQTQALALERLVPDAMVRSLLYLDQPLSREDLFEEPEALTPDARLSPQPVQPPFRREITVAAAERLSKLVLDTVAPLPAWARGCDQLAPRKKL